MSRQGGKLQVELMDQEVELGMGDLCRLCGVSREVIVEWVDEGVVEPRGRDRWRFSGSQLRRVRLAGSLQHDLGLETPALPLVLDLLEEVDALRRQVRVLQRLVE